MVPAGLDFQSVLQGSGCVRPSELLSSGSPIICTHYNVCLKVIVKAKAGCCVVSLSYTVLEGPGAGSHIPPTQKHFLFLLWSEITSRIFCCFPASGIQIFL